MPTSLASEPWALEETTLLGCKVGVINRIPASFFVSVAYNCWAYRRLGVKIDPVTGEIQEWMYQEGEDVDFDKMKEEAAVALEEKQKSVR